MLFIEKANILLIENTVYSSFKFEGRKARDAPIVVM